MIRAKLLAVLAVPALAAGAVAGCGTTSDQSSGQRGPARSDVLTKLVSDVKGSLQKSAETTTQANSVSLRFTGTSTGKKVSGSGVVSFRPSAMELTVDDGTNKATTRIVGTVVYVQIPATDRADLGGRSWLKMDLTKVAGDAANRQFGDLDPIKQIKTLLAGENVSAVGQEEIDGVRTAHYRAKVTQEEYLAQLDAKTRSSAKTHLERAGVDTMDIDVWMDEQYRPRRLHLVLGTDTDMTIDYTDYGKPVRIAAPPAKDTADFADLLGNVD